MTHKEIEMAATLSKKISDIDRLLLLLPSVTASVRVTFMPSPEEDPEELNIPKNSIIMAVSAMRNEMTEALKALGIYLTIDPSEHRDVQRNQ